MEPGRRRLWVRGVFLKWKNLCEFGNLVRELRTSDRELYFWYVVSFVMVFKVSHTYTPILTLQKKAVRLINFLPFRTHAIPYFAQSNILPITMLYFKLSITTNSAPQNICNLFTSTQDIYQYNTRSASKLVTTILIILGSIIMKTLFPSLGLKSGTAFPKAIEDYQSTYSKRKFKHYYL